MSFARNFCDTLEVLTPADTTWAIQLVDDNRGKTFRNFTFDEFDRWLEEFDWESNPKGKLSASERRVLTAKFAQKAMEMINSPHQRELTVNAATRTGLRMEVSENFDKIIPVR